MTNEEFIERLLQQFYPENNSINNHAKKLVSVAESAKRFMATKDTDEVWPHVYDALESSLKDLERE